MPMKQLILYIAMSLDGYIADEQGAVSWLEGDGSEPESMGSYPEFYNQLDAVILGYNTYRQIAEQLAPDAWPYEGLPSYVLTHRDPDTLELAHKDKLHLSSQPLSELLASLAESRIWLCGGATLVREAMASDLIDEYRICVIPCILGKGIRLFSPTDEQHLLRLTGVSHANGIAELCYTRR